MTTLQTSPTVAPEFKIKDIRPVLTLERAMGIFESIGTLDMGYLLDNAQPADFNVERLLNAAKILRQAQKTFDLEIARIKQL